MTSTDGDDRERGERPASAFEQSEEARRAAVGVVWMLTALAFGDPASAAKPEGFTHGVILGRRVARIAAGALLVVAGLALGAIAIRAPADLAAACVATWIAATLTYAVVRVIVAARGIARHRQATPALSRDTLRFRAHRLQNASTLVPYLGFVTTVAVPLGWMAYSLGAGAALSAVAMIASALVVYVGLRAVLDNEVTALGIDAVGAGPRPRIG